MFGLSYRNTRVVVVFRSVMNHLQYREGILETRLDVVVKEGGGCWRGHVKLGDGCGCYANPTSDQHMARVDLQPCTTPSQHARVAGSRDNITAAIYLV